MPNVLKDIYNLDDGKGKSRDYGRPKGPDGRLMGKDQAAHQQKAEKLKQREIDAQLPGQAKTKSKEDQSNVG